MAQKRSILNSGKFLLRGSLYGAVKGRGWGKQVAAAKKGVQQVSRGSKSVDAPTDTFSRSPSPITVFMNGPCMCSNYIQAMSRQHYTLGLDIP